MLETNGTLDFCPFRINTYASNTIQDESYQAFAPCIKEGCICYDKLQNGNVTREYCYRDNVCYVRRSEEE